ncbi:MAG: hypothetical protein ABF542_07520 [Gluconobacter sp.]
MTTEATAATETTTTEAPVEGASDASLLGAAEGGEQATTQAEGDGNGTGNPADGEAEKPVGPPEKYEFTAPEGFEVDQDSLTGFEDMAREAGLSQEQFAKVTEHGLKYFQDALGKQAEVHAAREKGWRDSALADSELSDGKTLLPGVMENAGKVFEQFGGNDLRKALAETGAGNHPVIIRALNQIGKALGVAGTPDVGKPAPDTKRGGSFEDIASRMYGKGS